MSIYFLFAISCSGQGHASMVHNKSNWTASVNTKGFTCPCLFIRSSMVSNMQLYVDWNTKWCHDSTQDHGYTDHCLCGCGTLGYPLQCAWDPFSGHHILLKISTSHFFLTPWCDIKFCALLAGWWWPIQIDDPVTTDVLLQVMKILDPADFDQSLLDETCWWL